MQAIIQLKNNYSVIQKRDSHRNKSIGKWLLIPIFRRRWNIITRQTDFIVNNLKYKFMHFLALITSCANLLFLSISDIPNTTFAAIMFIYFMAKSQYDAMCYGEETLTHKLIWKIGKIIQLISFIYSQMSTTLISLYKYSRAGTHTHTPNSRHIHIASQIIYIFRLG